MLVTSSGTAKVGTAVGIGVDGVAVIKLTGVPMNARPFASCGLLVGVALGAGVDVGVSVRVALGPGVGLRVMVGTGVKVAGTVFGVAVVIGDGDACGEDVASPSPASRSPRPESAPASPVALLLHPGSKAKTVMNRVRVANHRKRLGLTTSHHHLYQAKSVLPMSASWRFRRPGHLG